MTEALFTLNELAAVAELIGQFMAPTPQLCWPLLCDTARSSGTCPQPQTGLLSLVSGARKTTPGTGHAMDRRSSPTS
jgi:hypothetical protein